MISRQHGFLKRFYAALLFCVGMIVCSAAVSAAETAPPSDPGINAALQAHIESGDSIAGVVSVLARTDGTIISQNVLGYADMDAGVEMRADNIFWIASMTKPFTAVAVMMLVDEGKLSLDDPITKYIPAMQKLMVVESQNDGRLVLTKPVRPVTVRHLLCHTAGFAFLSEVQGFGLDVVPLELAALPSVTGPLQFQPGDNYLYSNQGINIAGRIIEIVSGMAYADFLQTRIFDPLEMTDTTFWPSGEQLGRLAKSYQYNSLQKKLEEMPIHYLNKPFNNQIVRHAEPGGGLFSTASDCTKFCLMLANGGEWAGKKLLTKEAISELKKDQTGNLKRNYGLCFERNDSYFGHGGAYGTRMAIDMRREIVAIFMIQCAGSPKAGAAMTDCVKAAEKMLENQ